MTLEQWMALREAFDAIPDENKRDALNKLSFRFFRIMEDAARSEPEWAREIDERDGVQ